MTRVLFMKQWLPGNCMRLKLYKLEFVLKKKINKDVFPLIHISLVFYLTLPALLSLNNITEKKIHDKNNKTKKISTY